MRCLLGLVLLIPFMVACSPDEAVINSFDDRWRLLASTRNGQLVLADMPSGSVIRTNLTETALGSPEPQRITAQRLFREDLFVLSADSSVLWVLDADSLYLRARVDCGTRGPAADIAFANATTALVSHPSTNVVSVLDLTVYTIASDIPVPGTPGALRALGNQIAVTCRTASAVAIIDSRTLAVEARVPVPPAPMYCEIDEALGLFCVVSLGAGRLDNEPATRPQLSFIRVTDRAVVGTVELSARDEDVATSRAGGLIVTDEQLAYVPLSNAVVRVNTRTRSRATTVLFEAFSATTWNPARREVCMVRSDSSGVDVFDPYLEGRRSSITISSPVMSIAPLLP